MVKKIKSYHLKIIKLNKYVTIVTGPFGTFFLIFIYLGICEYIHLCIKVLIYFND
jgi:hypothetical protein